MKVTFWLCTLILFVHRLNATPYDLYLVFFLAAVFLTLKAPLAKPSVWSWRVTVVGPPSPLILVF